VTSISVSFSGFVPIPVRVLSVAVLVAPSGPSTALEASASRMVRTIVMGRRAERDQQGVIDQRRLLSKENH